MTEHAKRVSRLVMSTIRQQIKGLTAGERYDVLDEVVDQAHDLFAAAKENMTPQEIAGIDVAIGESQSVGVDPTALDEAVEVVQKTYDPPLETDSVVDGSTEDPEE